MAKHTPGPWSVLPDMRTEVDSFSVERTEREYVAGYNIVSSIGEVVGCEGILPDGEANAQLIAAAPDLLLAAKDAAVTLANMIEAVRGDPRKSPCIMRLMEAVAKAEARP